MLGPRRNSPAGLAVSRMALWLVLIALLIGCDSPQPPAATPVAAVSPSPSATSQSTTADSYATAALNQTPGSTPTRAAQATTVPPYSPAASPEPSATFAPLQSPISWAPTIRWRGGDRYLLGVNYPYYHYGNDFGGNAWGNYGVHDPATYAVVDADFARMESLGLHTARWFVFADGRAGISYDSAGMPSGIDQYVTKDLDAALEIAQRHNVALNLVLLDFRFMWDARTDKGVALGGHASVLATPAGQQALVQNVFMPVFQRYAGNPAILSWEVMNEPEWAIQDAGTVTAEISHPVNLTTFRAFAKLAVDAIHSVARSYATIGCADAKWAKNWVDLGLDYYQIHYYDWMKPWSTDNLFGMRADSLQLERPVVVGEFPADHSAVAGLASYLDTWHTNGYAGAWAWSFRGDTTWGSPDPSVLGAWTGAHKADIDIPAAP